MRSSVYREGSLVAVVSQELTPLLINAGYDDDDEGNGNGRRDGPTRIWRALEPPEGVARRYLALLHTLAVAWNALMIPVIIAARLYGSQGVWDYVIYVFDYLFDLVFLFHLVVSIKTPRDRAQYLRTWFILDVVSVIPVDLAFWSPPWLHAVLRCNRLLRIFHINFSISLYERFSMKGPIFVQLAKLLSALLVVTHWVSCLWLLLSYAQNFATPWCLQPSLAQDPFALLYLYGYAWSWQVLARVGPYGAPTTAPEKAVTILLAVTSLVVGAVIIGEIGTLIAKANAKQTALSSKLRSLNEFMKHHTLPEDLAQKLIVALNTKSATHHLEDVQHILDRDISADLRARTALWLNRELLKTQPIFQSFGPASLAYLAPLLTLRHYAGGEYIVREGDDANSMFFISKGECQVIMEKKDLQGLAFGGVATMFSPQFEVVTTLAAGDHFGEGALVGDSRRNASVVASTHCEVSELSVSSLKRVLSKYPAEYVKLELRREDRRGKKVLRSMLPNASDLFLDAWEAKRYQRGDVISAHSLATGGAYLRCVGDLEVRHSETGAVVLRVFDGDEDLSTCIWGTVESPNLAPPAYYLRVLSERAIFLELASGARVDDKPLLVADVERRGLTLEYLCDLQRKRSTDRAYMLREHLSLSKEDIQLRLAQNPWIYELSDLWVRARQQALSTQEVLFSMDILELLNRELRAQLVTKGKL